MPWFDYLDSTRLSGFAGYALLRDGQFDASKALLTDAVAHLPRAAVTQKAVFLADIATVELAAGDLEQACASAGEAADSLRRAGYSVAHWRLRQFRSSVAQWADSAPVRALAEQLPVH